jgi:hypothetical protein
MTRRPLRILLLADGPDTGPGSPDYLATALALHGGFHVTRDDEDSAGPHDCVLLCASRMPSLSEVPADPSVPLIVLPRWPVGGAETEALVQSGAEDVLPLSEANPDRVEAAVLKAVGRRARFARAAAPVPPTRVPLRQAIAGIVPGLVAWHTPGPAIAEADAGW